MLKRAYGRCWGAIVLTKFGKRDPQSVGMERIEVVPIGAADRAEPADTFEDDGEREIVILNVGHMCEDKGTDVLLKAFAKIPDRYGAMKLRLVGECSSPDLEEDLDSLVEMASKRGEVELEGLKQPDELAACFRESDVFVFPSTAQIASVKDWT